MRRITVVEVITYRRYFSKIIITETAFNALPWLKRLFYKKLVRNEMLKKPDQEPSSRRAWLAQLGPTKASGGISHVTHIPVDAIPYSGLHNPLDPFMYGFLPIYGDSAGLPPDPERSPDLETNTGGDFGGGGAGSSYDDPPAQASSSHDHSSSSSHHDHSHDSSSSHSDHSSGYDSSSSWDSSSSYDSGSSYDSSSTDTSSSSCD
jgi:hypothetical protein